MDDFRNKVIEELNKEVKTNNCKVELEYYDYFVDSLGNYYINTKFSGALRRIQERVCKAFDFISKPKIMRASELVLRSLEINAGPKLTFPEEIEFLTRLEEIKESMPKRIEKLHIEVTIK